MKRKRYSDEQIAFALRQSENGRRIQKANSCVLCSYFLSVAGADDDAGNPCSRWRRSGAVDAKAALIADSVPLGKGGRRGRGNRVSRAGRAAPRSGGVVTLRNFGLGEVASVEQGMGRFRSFPPGGFPRWLVFT